MEVVPYFLSIIVTAVAIYWSVREFRRKPGTPTTGFFRYHEVLPSSMARSKARAAATQIRPRAAMRGAAPTPGPVPRPHGR